MGPRQLRVAVVCCSLVAAAVPAEVAHLAAFACWRTALAASFRRMGAAAAVAALLAAGVADGAVVAVVVAIVGVVASADAVVASADAVVAVVVAAVDIACQPVAGVECWHSTKHQPFDGPDSV